MGAREHVVRALLLLTACTNVEGRFKVRRLSCPGWVMIKVRPSDGLERLLIDGAVSGIEPAFLLFLAIQAWCVIEERATVVGSGIGIGSIERIQPSKRAIAMMLLGVSENSV